MTVQFEAGEAVNPSNYCLAVHYSQNLEPVKYKLLPLKFPLLVKDERLKGWVLLFSCTPYVHFCLKNFLFHSGSPENDPSQLSKTTLA